VPKNRHYAIADIFVDMTLVNMNYLSDITEVLLSRALTLSGGMLSDNSGKAHNISETITLACT